MGSNIHCLFIIIIGTKIIEIIKWMGSNIHCDNLNPQNMRQATKIWDKQPKDVLPLLEMNSIGLALVAQYYDQEFTYPPNIWISYYICLLKTQFSTKRIVLATHSSTLIFID